MPKVGDHPSPWTIVNDYTKTVVTLASALLAFTGTFSTSERMAAAPRWPLFFCWGLLALAIAAALYSAGRLTGVLKYRRGAYCCLLAANLSYFFLFGGILFFLLFAVLATGKPAAPPPTPSAATGAVELVPVASAMPPFASGSAVATADEFTRAICEARRKLHELGSSTAIVVGHHDQEELSKRATRGGNSNIGLAQQRADWVAQQLRSSTLACEAPAISHVLAVIGGPGKTAPAHRNLAELRALLANDRRVEVDALRYHAVEPKPAAIPSSH